MTGLEDFQNQIGYHFQSEELLRQALTHSSYANEMRSEQIRDNERLEFLGDAVLEIISSDILYHRYPDWPEGKLTRCRASIVCEQTLAFCCKEISLGKYVYLGKGEEKTGGRERPSVLSDAMEAVIGAIYLDGGIQEAAAFIRKFIMNDIEHMQLFHDSKTILQEIVQGQGGRLSYVLLEEKGPDHAKQYTVRAMIDENAYATGEGHTKKAAEQEAAYRTIISIKNNQGK